VLALRELRAAAGLTGEDVATRMGRAHSTLSRSENGGLIARVPDVAFMLGLYGVQSPEREALLRSAQADRGRPSAAQVARYDRRHAEGLHMIGRPTPGAALPDLSGAAWRTSSHSQGETACVEPAFLPDGGVAVRHSKDPGGSVLRYTRRDWDAFLKGAKDGEFDLS